MEIFLIFFHSIWPKILKYDPKYLLKIISAQYSGTELIEE